MLRDCKFAFRQLRKSPGYSLLAVLALALGIGANTAIFSAVETLFLRPLRFTAPNELVQVWGAFSDAALSQTPLSYPRFEAAAQRQDVFSGFAAFSGTAVTLTGRGDPRQLEAVRVTADFLRVLGLSPLLGRGFLASEQQDGGPSVAVLTYGGWQKVFSGDRDIVGRTVDLNGVPTTIIGVLPRSFGFPFAQQKLLLPRVRDTEGIPRAMIDHGTGFLSTVARLKPGVDPARANAELAAIAAAYGHDHPAAVDAKARLYGMSLNESLVGPQRPLLLLLLGAVGLVLVIACANVANLLFARFARRRKEIAIRAAVGATRAHILRQFLWESTLTALAAGTLGVLLAVWGVDVLARVAKDFLPRAEDLSLDGGVLLFSFILSVLTGVCLGLIPGLQMSRPDAGEVLKEASRGSTAGHRVGAFRSSLLVTEIGLSMILLAGAGLLVESFRLLRRADAGLRPQGVVSVNVSLPDGSYRTTPAKTAFYRAAVERLNAIPGVDAAGGTSSLPLTGNFSYAPYAVEGRPAPALSDRPVATRPTITPGYLATVGVPLRSGRDFTWRDTESSPRVVIINQRMASRLFPNQSPLGRSLITGIQSLPREIVGVVGDTRAVSLSQPPQDEMYYPTAQLGDAFFSLVLHSTRPPASLRGEISAALHAVDPNLPIVDLEPLSQLLEQSIATQQLATALVSGFAGFALLLAAMGIYTVIAYAVAQRTHEIGIRMALGAHPRTVFLMVLRQGMRVAVIGLAVGLGATLAATHLAASLLYEVQPNDPVILGGVTLFLGAVCAIACALPAWRAIRINPLTALRAG